MNRTTTDMENSAIPRVIAFALILWLTGGIASRAEFKVCNQTLDVVNLAVGKEVNETFQTEGWWTIGANHCVSVIREELTSRFVYIFAMDVFGQSVVKGSVEMCVGPRRFVINGIDSCWQRGHRSAKFLEVDTQLVERWTLFLRNDTGE